MVKQRLRPAPILPEKSHQVLPLSLLMRRSDNSRALVTGAQNALQVGMAAQPLEPFPSLDVLGLC